MVPTASPAVADVDDWLVSFIDPGVAVGASPALDVTWAETFDLFWVGANGLGGLHAHLEDFINDNLWWLNSINAWFAVDNHCGLICDGYDSTVITDESGQVIGGTVAQHGGWWFGDGGDGVAGTIGGSAGMLGNGGRGGDGYLT
jgi:hypothetical protein